MLNRRAKSAFTLVELMVVVLIIGVLIGILIPLVTKIKTRGYQVATLAQINALRGAIEAYQGTYNAYPGPLADIFMFQFDPGVDPLPRNVFPAVQGSHITQTENLVLGLMGGLRNNAGTIEYVPDDVGTGPRSLNPSSPGQHPAFHTDTKTLTKSSGGFFKDALSNAGCFDSSIPEFQDNFTEPLPILYLRARKGANGIISDSEYYGANKQGDLYQYDVRQYYGYIADTSSSPAKPLVLAGKKQSSPDGKSGLFTIASSDTTARSIGWQPGDPSSKGDPLYGDKDIANYAAAYFRHPTLNVPVATIQNSEGTPRSKDGFILISAGADRIFGTGDDLTTFGNVVP